MTEQGFGAQSYGRQTPGAESGTDTMHEAVGDVSQKVRSKIDSARTATADKLQGAADTLRDRSSRLPGGERVAGAAQSVADKLESSASYVQSHNTQEMLRDLMGVVKQHPGKSLLIAGALGFLIARVVRSD